MLKENKDPIKSTAWLSVAKESQNELVRLHKVINIGKSVSVEMSTALQIAEIIHTHLGAKHGWYGNFIEDLEKYCEGAEGGVFDHIHEYVNKYRTIENAAKFLAEQKTNEIQR